MVGKRGRSWEKGRKKERKTRRKRAGGGRDVWRFRVMRFNYKTRRVLQLAGRRARHPLPLSPFSPFSTRYLLRFDRLISPSLRFAAQLEKKKKIEIYLASSSLQIFEGSEKGDLNTMR